MLFLRGVPLSIADKIRPADVESRAYSIAQSAFDEARGPGTPLLPLPVSADVRGPAPYIRVAITKMLVRYASEGNPKPVGSNEERGAAEAQMALIEFLSGRAASGPSSGDAAELPTELQATRFAVGLSERVEWLQDAILASTVRSERATEDAETGAPSFSGETNAHLRMVSASSYWKTIPPHGGIEMAQSMSRAEALADAAASPTALREWPAEALPPRRIPYDLGATAAQLAGRLDAKNLPPVPPVSEDSLRTGILAKFSERNETAGGTASMVLTGKNVREFISKFDVMRSYVHEPL